MPTKTVKVEGLLKDGRMYLILFDREHTLEATKACGVFASNPQLNFDWYDAANLMRRILRDVK